jgi:hypothetical protein
MSTDGIWSISSSADAFLAKQLEAWRMMKNNEFSAESFFRVGFFGIVLKTPKEEKDAEYQVPSLDPATITPAGIASVLLILGAIGQDISVQTQMEGLKILNAKNLAHREDNLRKLEEKIRIALYKTPWQRLTNWMKHSFWGKFISSFIKIVTMIIALVTAVAATIATFGAAAPMLAFTIAACCLMTAEMATELATDGKSIGENIAESVTKDKKQAQKIAMGVDISLMILELGLSIGAVVSAPAMVAKTAADAAERAAQMAEKVTKMMQQVEKVTRYVEVAVTIAEAAINLSYAISQGDLVKAKASAEAERTKMEAVSEWLQYLIDQYTQQVTEALSGARDAYERVSKIIKEEAETKRLIANNLA